MKNDLLYLKELVSNWSAAWRGKLHNLTYWCKWMFTSSVIVKIITSAAEGKCSLTLALLWSELGFREQWQLVQTLTERFSALCFSLSCITWSNIWSELSNYWFMALTGKLRRDLIAEDKPLQSEIFKVYCCIIDKRECVLLFISVARLAFTCYCMGT